MLLVAMRDFLQIVLDDLSGLTDIVWIIQVFSDESDVGWETTVEQEIGIRDDGQRAKSGTVPV